MGALRLAGRLLRKPLEPARRRLAALLDPVARPSPPPSAAGDAPRREADHYQAVFEHMLEGYALCRMLFDGWLPVDFVYLDVNRAFERLTGLRDVVGKRISELIPDVRRTNPEIFEIYGRVASTGQPERFEMRIEPLGRWFSVAVYSPRDGHFVTVFDDVTARKEVEDALKESECRFRSLFQTMTDGVALHEMVYDARGVAVDYRVIEVNAAFERHTGIPAERARGARATELYGMGRAPYIETYDRVARTGEPTTFETYFAPLQRHFAINVCPPRDGWFATIFSDITSRKNAERDRDAMERQLRHARKLGSTGQLAAGIAHEIDTPTQQLGDHVRFLQDAFVDLRTLLAHCRDVSAAFGRQAPDLDLLRAVDRASRASDLDYLLAAIPRALEQSLDGIGRVARVVRVMKDLSHPDGDAKAPVDLNEAIVATVHGARDEWQHVADMVTQLDPTLPPVPCHGGELEQVILSLVTNAAHAIADVVGDGGTGKGTITITTHRNGEWAEVRVADTGSGCGQDLAIAHAVIVEKHGGTLGFETSPGRGTTFVLRLPGQGAQPLDPERGCG